VKHAAIRFNMQMKHVRALVSSKQHAFTTVVLILSARHAE